MQERKIFNRIILYVADEFIVHNGSLILKYSGVISPNRIVVGKFINKKLVWTTKAIERTYKPLYDEWLTNSTLQPYLVSGGYIRYRKMDYL